MSAVLESRVTGGTTLSGLAYRLPRNAACLVARFGLSSTFLTFKTASLTLCDAHQELDIRRQDLKSWLCISSVRLHLFEPNVSKFSAGKLHFGCHYHFCATLKLKDVASTLVPIR